MKVKVWKRPAEQDRWEHDRCRYSVTLWWDADNWISTSGSTVCAAARSLIRSIIMDRLGISTLVGSSVRRALG